MLHIVSKHDSENLFLTQFIAGKGLHMFIAVHFVSSAYG